MLNVANLTVSFKVFRGIANVLDGVNFKVRENEVVALVGETGCGKSLTLKSIAQSLSIKRALISGSIIFKGSDLLKLSKKDSRQIIKEHISMIPQNVMASLNPKMTISQQLSELIYFKDKQMSQPWQVAQGIPRDEKLIVEEKAIELLKIVSLYEPEKILNS